MSIASELENFNLYLTDAYNACEEREAEMPMKKNLQNLKPCIQSIPAGGGYDLYNIGSTVLVEVQSGIAKGKVWEGVRNDEYSQNTLNEQAITNNGAYYFSKDLSIGYSNSYSVTTSTKSIKLWFWNEEVATYDVVSIDVSSVAPSLSGTLSSLRITDDGTLAVLRGSKQSTLMFLEIDKENKTATPYVVGFKYVSTSTNLPLLFGDKYIVNYCGATTDSEGNSLGQGLDFYRYDTETHELYYINRAGTVSSVDLGGATQVAEVLPDTWVCSGGSGKIAKLTLSGSKFSYANGSIPSYNNFSLSSDGQYFTTRSGYTNNLCKLNAQDLTYEVIATNTYSGSQYIWAIDGITLISQQTTGVNSEIYDVSGGAFENWVLLASGTSFMPQYTNYIWSPAKWMGSTRAKIFSFPQNSEAQFLIKPMTTTATETGKFYGIAPKSLNLGDIDYAQLLFIGG